MQKPKAYDWQDSNMALFGSKEDRDTKKAAAETEEAWKGCGQKVGIEIWRINKFKVEKWPAEAYGSFFNGDSYIILNTYKEPEQDALLYDLHFWIGKYSTQDEYGTAAYKTVELDTLLDDKPVQHREVMNNESNLFKSYFPSITLLEGGADTGFKRVTKQDLKPTLLHFHGDKKKIYSQERPLNLKNLDSSDVFILETADMIYQWNGKSCNKDEKFHAVRFCQDLRQKRHGKVKCETLDEGDFEDDHIFYTFFSDDNPVVEPEKAFEKSTVKKLLRLSDASGTMEMTEVATGADINPGKFDTNDIFILDKPDACYVWLGKGASDEEKRQWPTYSHKYLAETGDICKSISAVKEGREPKGFFN